MKSRYTEEQLRAVVAAYERLGSTGAARELGVTVNVVSNCLRTARIQGIPVGKPQADGRASNIPVRDVISRHGLWTEAEDAVIRACQADGNKNVAKRVALLTGRTAMAVDRRIGVLKKRPIKTPTLRVADVALRGRNLDSRGLLDLIALSPHRSLGSRLAS